MFLTTAEQIREEWMEIRAIIHELDDGARGYSLAEAEEILQRAERLVCLLKEM